LFDILHYHPKQIKRNEMPTATESGAMSLVTKLKVPTTAFSPTVTPGMTTLWLPTLQFFFKVTFPRFPVHAAWQPITIKNNQRPQPPHSVFCNGHERPPRSAKPEHASGESKRITDFGSRLKSVTRFNILICIPFAALGWI